MLQLLRSYKDRLAHKYYHFRIHSLADPYRIRGRKQPIKILFILSHMRSGSSLLTHILNSNPEIIGYGETHLNYASELDFKKLIFKVYWQLKDYQMNHQYILDKVLHNHKFIEHNFLLSEQVYCIYLLREPQRTLPSILALKSHWSESKALNYYIDRLAILENYAQLIKSNHSLFITYDQLVNQSSLVFNALKSFLGTQEGFSANYKTLKTTGMKGVGDSSDNIKTGQIIKTARNLEQTISAELTEQAEKAFNQCYSTLAKYCLSIE